MRSLAARSDHADRPAASAGASRTTATYLERLLGSWIPDLVDLVLPRGCVVCRRWLSRTEGLHLLCSTCRSRLSEPSWPRCPRCHRPRGTGREAAPTCLDCEGWPAELAAARYAYVLRSPASDLVHALKYEGWAELARPMGDALAGALLIERSAQRRDDGLWGDRTMVVPIPTTERRERERGYNQAELLARRVAERLDLPLRAALVRTHGVTSQTTLAPDARRENVRGAFALGRGPGVVRGRAVILVDDVLTTGATASEAAGVLSGAGAERITLATFARALPDPVRQAGAGRAA